MGSNQQALIVTAQALVADDKGILAMDESNPTCNKRFAALGVPQTEEARRAYREMIVTTPQLGACISGETEWTFNSQHRELTGIRLTAFGEDEVREWGKRLCGISFNHVVTSPLQYARRTCELVGLSCGMHLHTKRPAWIPCPALLITCP